MPPPLAPVISQLHARVEAFTKSVTHLEEITRIEQIALEAGAGTQTEFLRAEANLRRSRALWVQANHSEIMAHVELARLMGDLTPAWVEQHLEVPQ